LEKTLGNISSTLSDGGIGIGLPVGLPSRSLIRKKFLRYFNWQPNERNHLQPRKGEQYISYTGSHSDAMLTGAALHIVHINSSSLSHIPLALEIVDAAQKKGFDITTELYPYPAASTLLQSAFFDEGWQEKMGISYGDLQWVDTGERLTKETFDKYRKSGGIVIIYAMKPEWIKTGIGSPVTMIASDGMLYAKLAIAHSMNFSPRVLGKYCTVKKKF
jgi:dihydroorotase